jgi:hypothetical protein
VSLRGHHVAAAAFALAIAALLVFAAPSPAPVAPRNCGEITVKSRDYQIKADQIRCRTAKRWSRSYLGSGWRPTGYSCRKGSTGSQLKFRCWKREKTYFAIKR